MTTKAQYQKAKGVLDALVSGIDPETGTELPETCVVNRIAVNRAMHTARTALEQLTARMTRRSMLPSGVGKPWSDDEEEQLRQEFEHIDQIPAIAAGHNRTVRAIEARLERMGLLDPSQRTTNNSFTGVPPKKGD